MTSRLACLPEGERSGAINCCVQILQVVPGRSKQRIRVLAQIGWLEMEFGKLKVQSLRSDDFRWTDAISEKSLMTWNSVRLMTNALN